MDERVCPCCGKSLRGRTLIFMGDEPFCCIANDLLELIEIEAKEEGISVEEWLTKYMLWLTSYGKNPFIC